MGKLVYGFHPTSTEYVGKVEAQESPLEPGIYLDDIPNTLKAAPPEIGANETIIAKDGKWVIVPDFRGIWYKQNRDAVEITELDVRPDSSWSKVQPPKTTAVIITEVWEDIKNERDAKKSGGVKVVIGDTDYWFHSDDASRIQQLGLKDQARDVLAAGGNASDIMQKLGQDILWKTMSGAYVPMTVQLAIDIVAAVGNLDATLFGVAAYHEAQLKSSQNPAAYNFSTGWPKAFSE